jgi:hypothetical protein
MGPISYGIVGARGAQLVEPGVYSPLVHREPRLIINIYSTCLQYLFKEALTYHQQLRTYLQHKTTEHQHAAAKNNSSALAITNSHFYRLYR